jgi:hypothetical protein
MFLRYRQDVGDIRVFSTRLVRILRHCFAPLFALMASSAATFPLTSVSLQRSATIAPQDEARSR